MEDTDHDADTDGKLEGLPCHICGKRLSRKQRLSSHLLSVHNIKPEHSPEKYKRYENDLNVPVPRSTHFFQRKKYESPSHNERVQTNFYDDAEQTYAETSMSPQDDEVISSEVSLTGGECELENESVPDGTITQPGVSTLADDTQIFEENCEILSDSDTGSYDSVSVTSDSEYEESIPSDEIELESQKIPKFSEQEETCMTLLSYILKHHLSWQASNDFIEIFRNFTDYKDINIDQIKQTVGECHVDVIDFCEKCLTLFPENEEQILCSQVGCGGLRFKGTLNKQSEKKRKSYFVCLPLHSQLKDILERDGVWEAICNYKKKCKSATTITDILNGELYKSLSSKDNLLEENSLTMLFNTDGAPLYKSSGVSIWPVYLVVNELPPHMRFSRKNMILWGVWQAKGKPMFQTFFNPFIKQMIDLKTNGIKVDLHGETMAIKVILLAGTMDLQAKALVTEMTAHNGEFGCLTCEEPGQVVKRGKGHCRVFPYRENPPNIRTSAEILEHGMQAMRSKKPVKGIKNVSCLHGMDWFDVVFGLVPDYMHGTLLGVTKQILQLLLSSKNSKKPFFLGDSIDDIDSMLKNMMPTDDVSRLPRKLEKNLHHLKASELEMWLIFYSIPCLTDIMDPVYLNHYALLVEGIYILLGDDISDSKINRAERVLLEFYHSFSDLYGYDNCTLNLHNICQHLVTYVKKLGPLWAWSCFVFEDMNGSLLDYAHGTGDVCMQILWTIQAQKRLAVDVNSITNYNLRNLVKKMVKSGRSVTVKLESDNCKIAGGLKPFILPPNLIVKIRTCLSIAEDEPLGDVFKILRIVIGETIFFSREYSRMKKRIAHTVLTKDDRVFIGSVNYFIYHKNSNLCFAVLNKLEMSDTPLLHPLINHLICLKKEVEQSEEKVIIPVDQLREKVLVLRGNKNYNIICKLPNLYALSV